MLKRLFCINNSNVNEFNNVEQIKNKYNFINLDNIQNTELLLDIFNGSYLPYLNTKDNETLRILGMYYLCQKDYPKMEHYLKKCYGDNVYQLLGKIYKDLNMEQKLVHNFLIAVNFGYKYGYYNIGSYYFYLGDFEKAKNYFLYGFENNEEKSTNALGYYYTNIEEDYDKMLFYYFKAIELNYQNSIYNIRNYYIKKNLDCFTELLLYSKTNKLKYNKLFNLILESKQVLLLFYDTVFDKKFDECNICCNEETELNILNCGHHLCYRCIYKIIDKNECPYCRKSLLIYT